jgi:aspartyl/asparaginyl-tRNA synthetase
MRWKTLFMVSVFGLLAIFGACSSSPHTQIKELYRNPPGYDGQKVLIAGTVKDSVNIVGLKYFVVQDATGEVPVLTEKAIPPTGNQVRVKGTVNQSVAIGRRIYLVILEE